MSRDLHDALLDHLLRELLGGDRPRDLTTRVLARAKLHDRIRRHWWIGTGAAVAASLILAASLWFLWPQSADSYPEPAVTEGAIYIPDGGSLVRGRAIITQTEPATISYPGFASVRVQPESALTLAGTRLAEQVLLDRGTLDITVNKKRKGSFDVLVGPAKVHVVGTQFSVTAQPAISNGELGKNLHVEVTDGTVRVSMPNAEEQALTDNESEDYFIPLESRTKIAPPTKTDEPRLITTGPADTAPASHPATLPGPTTRERGDRGNTAGAARGPAATRAADGPRANRLNATRPQPKEPALNIKDFKMIEPKEALELLGLLRKAPDFYYLEHPRGNIILFSQQSPPPNFQPALVGKRVRVLWDDHGKLNTILPANPARGN